MKYNPDLHHRRSIRLQGYDYSSAGAYFITICTLNRECLFGAIDDGGMRLNDAGLMVEQWYCELENKYPDIQCDEFVCMPNHTHFIVINVGADLRVRPDTNTPKPINNGKHINMGEHIGSPLHAHPDPNSGEPINTRKHINMGEHIGSPLHGVVQWFKTMTTNAYIRGVEQHGWPPFPRKLWQRNYWEHVIRNESELYQFQEYIQNNPARWETDRLYRQHIPDSNTNAPAASGGEK